MIDLNERFSYLPPKGDQAERQERILSKAKEFAQVILDNSAFGREQAIALTELETATSWAIKAISRES